jgi:hypothetical protein
VRFQERAHYPKVSNWQSARRERASFMNQILICVLTMMLAFASAAAGAEIDSMAWNQTNIERLQAMGKDAVFRFLLRQVDPDNEMEWTETSLNWDYKWYPAGNGKYELAIGYQSGPDVAYFTIFGGMRRERSDLRNWGARGMPARNGTTARRRPI